MISKKIEPLEPSNVTTITNQRFIMLIDYQPTLSRQLADILGDSTISIASTPRWDRALELAAAGRIHLMICDLELPNQGAEKLFLEVKSNHPNFLQSLLFSRNIVSRPEADFLSRTEQREVLDKPFKNDQAQKILMRRLTRA